MKRATNAEKGLTSRVYTYGAVPSRIAPVLNEEAAIHQMWLANRMWNVLVSIERAHMEAYKRIMSDDNQIKADALKAEITALQAEIKQRRQRARKRVDVTDLKEAIRAKKDERGAVLDLLKSTKEARLEARSEQLKASSKRTQRRIVRARQAAARMGLFWGSYNDIVQRADAGKKLGDIKYRRFRHTGTLTAQIMNGALVSACVGGTHTFFQLEPPPHLSAEEREWAENVRARYVVLQKQPRTANNRAQLAALAPDCQRARALLRRWGYARMRIGSTGPGDRTPIWVELPIVYERELPPAAMIKSVSVTRRIVADEVRWQLNVTISQPIVAVKAPGRVLALDLGWRLRGDGVRVGFWLDTDGNHEEILVSGSDISQFKKIDDLKSICDRQRDEFLPALAEWIGGRRSQLSAEWLRRSTYIERWRSCDRLEALIGWWRDNRLPDDTEVFEAAIEWRRQYRRLALWRRNLQDQMTARVREQYRQFAVAVAGRYSHVVIENFDLREVIKTKKKPAEAEPKAGGEAKGTYRQMVSPSRLRDAVRNACGREGVVVVERPAAYTTLACHRCLTVTKWDAAESVLHTCEACGMVFDQDYNAAVNLLQGWLTESSGPAVGAAA